MIIPVQSVVTQRLYIFNLRQDEQRRVWGCIMCVQIKSVHTGGLSEFVLGTAVLLVCDPHLKQSSNNIIIVSKYCNIINVTFRWHFENLAFERISFMGAQLQIYEQNKLKIFLIGYRYC